VLQGILGDHVQRRYSDWQDMAGSEEQDETSAGESYAKLPQFARRNEVISAIATAIAALARVKEL
jgi:hypothetical protein